MLSVVIVDDSQDIRTLLELQLDKSDEFNVCAAGGTGQDAIDLARELRPDVVLLDLSLPDMDGLAALPPILAASPGTRVVLHSGYHPEQFAEQAYALGASGCLEKSPRGGLLPDRLLAALNSAAA